MSDNPHENIDSTQLCSVKIEPWHNQMRLSKGIVFPLMPVRVESNKDIDCIDHSRDIAKDCEQQADAELYLLRHKKACHQYVTGIVNVNRVTRIKQTIVYRHHCSIPLSLMIQISQISCVIYSLFHQEKNVAAKWMLLTCPRTEYHCYINVIGLWGLMKYQTWIYALVLDTVFCRKPNQKPSQHKWATQEWSKTGTTLYARIYEYRHKISEAANRLTLLYFGIQIKQRPNSLESNNSPTET